jgi:hypothetical protein
MQVEKKKNSKTQKEERINKLNKRSPEIMRKKIYTVYQMINRYY